ncbi:hypothetical protein L1987_23687 [Smallanthus sonchifolius]|uniref:Uncharacterized protein n=1 Tax=Smallanthus sonchifolius TaxID=185202 RepID=A0ACB9IJP2_9ASTR|nr:hypothetical protein L1987_23687 [Smallanthus sonchifolius]
MEKERDKEETRVPAKDSGTGEGNENRLNHPVISSMEPLTHEAYGGGMYGKDDDKPPPKDARELPASETQSADGPSETALTEPKHKPPPSSGDRDIDITGQSYIQ